MDTAISTMKTYYPCNGNLKSHKWFCSICWKDTSDIIRHMTKADHLEKLRKSQYLDVITGNITITCPICTKLVNAKKTE